MTKALSTCAIYGLLAGYAFPAGAASDDDWRERLFQDARRPGVIAQFCALQTEVPGQLPARTVHREHGKPRSIGSTLTRYLGTSSSGQFVFQSHLGKLEEFTAAIVSPSGPEQQVFLARPSLYSGQGWSRWVPPDLVSEDREIQFNLMNGRSVGRHNQGRITVLARFKVGSYVQWREETDGINTGNLKSGLEPCPLAPNS